LGNLQTQCAAFDIVHQQKRQSIGLFQPIKTHDISVLQTDQRLCIALEIAQKEFVFSQVELQQF
jgi:hypothetical protein